jgi:hypothetical protein|tara:strand:+ start:907 stop:1053 length:147 start_codon:yes stop_codon:yes gene_type:complete
MNKSYRATKRAKRLNQEAPVVARPVAKPAKKAPAKPRKRAPKKVVKKD